jgi:hypothetical protein
MTDLQSSSVIFGGSMHWPYTKQDILAGAWDRIPHTSRPKTKLNELITEYQLQVSQKITALIYVRGQEILKAEGEDQLRAQRRSILQKLNHRAPEAFITYAEDLKLAQDDDVPHILAMAKAVLEWADIRDDVDHFTYLTVDEATRFLNAEKDRLLVKETPPAPPPGWNQLALF